MAKKTSAVEAELREVVGSVFNADGALNIDVVLDFIAWAWPDIKLYPFQEFYIEKALTVPNLFIEACRAASKTWMNALVAVVKQIIWPGRIVLITGPTYRQAKDVFLAMRGFLESSPRLEGIVVPSRGTSGIGTEAAEQAEIHFTNGSRTLALPASGSKIHGKRASDLIFTEFFVYPKDLYLRTVRPMKYGAARKVFPGMPRSEIIETTGGWVAGAADDGYAYKKRSLFVEQMEAGNPDYYLLSLDVDDLVEFDYFDQRQVDSIIELRLDDEDIWQQQFKNVWLTTTGSYYSLAVLDQSNLKRCEVELLASPNAMYVAGLDVGWSDRPEAGDTVFSVWRLGVGYPALPYVWTWHDSNTNRLASEIAGLLKQFNVSLLVADAQGAGHSVLLSLADDYGFTEIGDKNRLGRQIIFRYPHGVPVINEDHSSFKAAVINATLSFPAYPGADEGDKRRVYDLIAVGLKQFANLRTKLLPSNLLHFEQPSGEKKDIAMSILYGWHAVRMTTEVRSLPRKPGLILEPIPYDPFGL